MAVAEAIDNAMNTSQFVTVPILDARLAELRAELRGDYGAGLLRLEHKIDTRCAELDHKIDSTRVGLESKMDVAVAELGKRIEGVKSELMRWILLTMLGSAAIQAASTAFVNALQHH